MKLNLINIVAAILIAGGVFLLVKRNAKPETTATSRPVSDEDLKQLAYTQVGHELGRPLDDIEKQMVTVVRHGDHATVTVVEPLNSRVVAAQRRARAQNPNGGTTSSSGNMTEPPAIPSSLPNSGTMTGTGTGSAALNNSMPAATTMPAAQ